MWLNNACMAAVWLFPAVTALHAIIIASVHANGKFLIQNKYLSIVDMYIL